MHTDVSGHSGGTVRLVSLGLIYWAVPILHLTFPVNFNVLPGLENREHKGSLQGLAISVPSNIPDTG